MHKKEQVSSGQFFSLLFTFLIGTSAMLLPVVKAGRDAWIAVLVAALAGIALFGLYAAVASMFPGKTLIGAARLALGPVVGTAVGTLYVWFFLHLGALVMRNLLELYATAIMLQTPVVVHAVVMVVLAAWAVTLGLEVIARTTELLTFLLLMATVTHDILVFGTPDLTHLERILPILEKGLQPVIQGAIPALSFPFGEAILFAMIIHNLASPRKSWSIASRGMSVAGLVLSLVVLRNIAALGPDEIARQTIPSLTTLTMINLAEFVQRIDAVVVLVWTYAILAKFMIVYYVLASGLAELVHLSTYRPLVLPLGIILTALSIIVYRDFGEMASFATEGYPAYAFVFEIVLPVLILAAGILKTRRKKTTSKM